MDTPQEHTREQNVAVYVQQIVKGILEEIFDILQERISKPTGEQVVNVPEKEILEGSWRSTGALSQ